MLLIYHLSLVVMSPLTRQQSVDDVVDVRREPRMDRHGLLAALGVAVNLA